MKFSARTIAILIAIVGVAGLVWRSVARRQTSPCPWWLGWVLENPYTNAVAGSSKILDRLDLAPGMRVLDVGSGPGRITIPAARRVGRGGEVVAFDVQSEMLRMVEQRAAAEGLTNVRTLEGGIGQGLLERDAFDRALMVAVLGEVPDREAAMREIYTALKPGGLFAVVEAMPDPHYQSRETVRRLAESAGFRLDREYGGWFAFTQRFVKPTRVEAPEDER